MYIYIGFSRPVHKPIPIFSWLIRLVENTKFSHVYLEFKLSQLDRRMIYEAAGTEVRLIERSNWDKHAESLEVYTFSIDLDQFVRLQKLIVDSLGNKYGIKQLFGIAIAKLFRLKKNPLSGGKGEAVCSEVVSRVMVDILNYRIDKDFDLITPKDVKNILESTKNPYKNA